jgi:hypothetical protein
MLRETLQNGGMGDTGTEQGADSTGNSLNSGQSGAESGAVGALVCLNDSRLVAVIDAWPTLPEPAKASILATIVAARDAL